jgi:hypothetical protein
MVDPSLILTMSTPPSPLVDLVQAIHLPSHRFLLTTSANPESASLIDLNLFAPRPVSDDRDMRDDSESSGSSSSLASRSIITWRGEIDLDKSKVCSKT